MSSSTEPESSPPQSPFFRALQTDRYERQDHIRAYEEATGRILVVFCGPIVPDIITPFADAILDADTNIPLDLMLTSLGGDGETALRMASMCHADRAEFRVIVPDTAASAATLLALAAESIAMSSTSALGPIDPQVLLPHRDGYYPAKDILAIVDDLDNRTRENPQAFELYAALLADVDAVVYQIAKAAIGRMEELVPEVMRLRCPPPSDDQVQQVIKNLQGQAMHSAAIGHSRAGELGLPTQYLAPQSEQWDMLWRLHTMYVVLRGASSNTSVIEGRRVSLIRERS
ncbi:MAG: hypothetical protein OXF75_11595 [Acidimicrobiaceae bacterium]|nr:hypothetical protein [Acidimicrobiaceae bacterium]